MDIQRFLLFVPVLLFSVTAHEYAHGWAARRQGDPTAEQLGRLTWNPVKHIDPFMTLLLPLMLWIMSGGNMLLGGAKPVPVNPANYRNYVRGDIIVSLAGVFANLLLAVASVGMFVLIGMVGRGMPTADGALGLAQAMMILGLQLNLILIAFNLIPIPPLDGSHVVKHALPPAWAVRYQEIGRYGIVILILLIGFGRDLLTTWMRPAMEFGRFMLRFAYPFALPTIGRWLS